MGHYQMIDTKHSRCVNVDEVKNIAAAMRADYHIDGNRAECFDLLSRAYACSKNKKSLL